MSGGRGSKGGGKGAGGSAGGGRSRGPGSHAGGGRSTGAGGRSFAAGGKPTGAGSRSGFRAASAEGIAGKARYARKQAREGDPASPTRSENDSRRSRLRPSAETSREEAGSARSAAGRVTRNASPARPGRTRAAAPRANLRTEGPGAAEIVKSKPRVKPAPVGPGKVELVTIGPDEAGMRIDRFLEARYPGLSFSHIQRVVRKGQLRLDGKRVDSKDRVELGQVVRVPPITVTAPTRAPASDDEKTRAFLADITLFEDDDVLVINKPYGLAVQGGSGTTRHVDGMLAALTGRDGQRPRLVHRLDKDTAGCLLIAKSRFAASTMAARFRSRETRKIYWAMVAGVPRQKQGRISSFLAKDEEIEGEARMRMARHGEDGASHALTYYAVVEAAAQKMSWLSLKPVTGRTHQLRVHCAEMGHPIIGDPKYFNIENYEFPGGIQNRLHLLARRIVIPHPRDKGLIDVSAPLPPHMAQSFALFGFDTKQYDPIEEAPEE